MLNHYQRQRLAVLRVKRSMPSEFKLLGIRYSVHAAINGKPSKKQISKRNALAVFSDWISRPRALSFNMLVRLANDVDDVDSVRGNTRKRIAKRILKDRGWQ